MQFDVTALTPRRTMLDIKKLEGINKKHLQSMIDSDEGIEVLAAETRKSMEEAHPRFIEYVDNLHSRAFMANNFGHLLTLAS